MAWAQSYSLSTDPSADLLTITMPKNATPPVVVRTGPRRLEVRFPEGAKLGQGGGVRGRHVERLVPTDNVLLVETSGEAFGFVASPKGKSGIQVQVFFDPAGARWKPPAGQESRPPRGQAPQAKPPGDAARKDGPPASGAMTTPGALPGGPPTPAPAPGPDPALPPLQTPSSEVKGTIDFSGTGRSAPLSSAPGQASAQSPTPVSTSQGPVTASAPAPAPATAQTNAPVQARPSASAPVQAPAAASAQAPATGAVPAPATEKTLPSAGGSSVTGQVRIAQNSPAGPSKEQPVAASDAQPAAPASTADSPAAPGPQRPAPAPGEVRGTIVPGGPSAAPAQPEAAPAMPAGPGPASPPTTVGQAPQGAAPATPAGPLPAPASPGEPAPAAPAAQGASPGQPLAPGPDAPPATEEPTPEDLADKESLENTTLAISGEQALAREEYAKALGVAESLLEKPNLSKELRETALYLKAESLFALNRDKLAETYVETNDALQQALNFNTTSHRLPRALMKLGLLNLKQGNIPEARAYFNLLARKYPLDEEVPLIDVSWGEYYMDQARQRDAKANHQRAADAFKQVLSKHPESRFARDAALGLSRALLEMDQYAEAEKIVDYVDKRWPRYYVENPVLRRVSADIAYKLGQFEQAKDDYLWFYNLVPNDPSNDLVLARLGDVNIKLGKRDAAREFYDMAIRMHPGKEGALMAMMRLAEQGIHDAPTLQEMFKAFADPKDIRPDKIYEIIAGEYPKSPLAPLALLKLAMWRLYKQEYPETLDLVSRFTKAYPGDELEKQAVEVGAQAFGKMVGGLLEQMDYKRILELWQSYPFLATRQDVLSDTERLGVALSLYYQGAPKQALAMAEPFLEKGPGPGPQKALALMLAIYRENQDWQAILDTLKKVSSWSLAPGPKRALEFAQALALEHTGQKALSRLLWARLAADNELTADKRAYAVYYQARTAYDRKDYDKAMNWALDSRNLFKEAAKDDGKARDALLLMIEANQAAGRYREALALCAEYEAEAPPEGAEWAANRLRMAKLHRLLGDTDQWRKILVEMRDSQSGSLYGKLAASELAARSIEERAGRLSGPP